jgi:hypothetical protein
VLFNKKLCPAGMIPREQSLCERAKGRLQFAGVDALTISSLAKAN